MIKRYVQRRSFIIKTMVFYLLFVALLAVSLYKILEQLVHGLAKHHQISLSMNSLFSYIDTKLLGMSLGLSFILVMLYALDVSWFFNGIKDAIKESLVDKKLYDYFSHFSEGKSFLSVKQHLDQFLSMYKSFDNMKTARIALEVSSNRQLINHIKDGVLFVNKDKIVTHINHSGEHVLGLIPGEIIGESLSRKISHKRLLDIVDKALQFDQKVIDEAITVKGHSPVQTSIYPIKDKFGEVVRALVIFRPEPPVPNKT